MSKAWDRREGESLRAYERFIYYLDLGPKRKYAAVAERFGIRERTAKDMAARHRWNERVLAKVMDDTAEWQEQLKEHILRSRKNQLRAADKILDMLLKRLKDMDEDEIPAFQVARMLRDVGKVYSEFQPVDEHVAGGHEITVRWVTSDTDED